MKNKERRFLAFATTLLATCAFMCDAFASFTRESAGAVGKQAFSRFGYQIISRQVHEVGDRSKYTIDVQYPEIMGDPAGSDKFNFEAKMLVFGEINQFKGSTFREMDANILKQRSHESSLSIDYEITHAGNDVISILFNASIYMEGAAHPNSYAWVMNYSLARSKILELPFLFWPDSNYLAFISQYCFESLKNCECVLEDELRINTAPLGKNFRNWNFVPEGLRFTFDPYEVACYAAGPQEVVIPYLKLIEILKPQYSLNYTPKIKTDRRLGKRYY